MACATPGRGKRVAIIELEMDLDAVYCRVFAHHCQVPLHLIERRELTSTHKALIEDAAPLIYDIPFYVNDKIARDIKSIEQALERFTEEYGPVDLAILDHLHRIGGFERYGSLYAEVSAAAVAAKELARKLDTVMISISQLRRNPETEHRRPELGDLRESGRIEEESDIVLATHLPGRYFAGDQSRKEEAELIGLKNRNGELFLRSVRWRGEFQTFYTLAAEEAPPDLKPPPVATRDRRKTATEPQQERLDGMPSNGHYPD